MEQESKNREAPPSQPASVPPLCANKCGFFGSPATNNLCSKCFRDHFLSTSIAAAGDEASHKGAAFAEVAATGADPSHKGGAFGAATASGADVAAAGGEASHKAAVLSEVGPTSSAPAPAPAPKKPKNRCAFCNKKVGLMGFECRCGEVFCGVHRYSDKHECVFDYKGAGQDAIARANPVVKADKVDKF